MRAPATPMLALVAILAGCGPEPPAEQPDAGPAQPAFNPPGPDVWLAELTWESGGPPTISTPVNLTRRAGYDNQPTFVPDGTGLWYTAVDEDIGQADIWRYDFASGTVTRITASSPESEYSATPLPDGSGISVVRVEADSTQRLWRFDLDGADGSVLLEDVAPVGYHAWADERTVVVFVLGDPPTLRRVDVLTGAAEVIAEDVGRSIQGVPGSSDVSYVQNEPDGTTSIMRLGPGSARPERIIDGVEGGDFHAWAPDGTLLMAHEFIVYGWTPGASAGWEPVGDFSRQRLTVTRLAVSPDGSQIALVGEVAF